jgi:hypothetical protein
VAAAAITELLAAAADHQGRWEFGAAREILADLVSAADPADDSLELLTARRMLAEVLRELDRTAEAHAIAADLVTACEARLGPAHPATVRATAVLAAILHDRAEPETEAGADDLARAEGLYLDVIAEPGLEPDDGDPAGPTARAVALARANLALLHRDRGDLRRARDELVEVYARFRRVHGSGDPDTIRLAVELAALQRQCGDLPAARRLLAVAHSAARSAFAEDHPLTRVVEFELTEIEPPMPVGLDATGRHGPRLLRRGAHEPRALPAAPVSPAIPAPVSPAIPAPVSPSAPVSPPAPVNPPAIDAAPPVIPRQRTPASLPAPSPLARPVYAEPAPVVSRPAWETPRPRPHWSAARWRIVAVPLSVLAVLIVAAAVAVARGGGSTPATDPGAASAGRSAGAKATGSRATPKPSRSRAAAPPHSYPPPTGVSVRDDRRSLTVSWTDLSQGVARQTVTIGRPGHAPIIVAPVPVGVNHFTLAGVSPDFDYCATVTLTYGPGEANQVAADPVCTRRAGA